MSKELKIGEQAPDFSLKDQDDSSITLESLAGKWVVLYFYPKDNTSGCTVEALEFSALKGDFEKIDTLILGISPDSVKSHRGFIEKKELTVRLLSDPEHQVIESFGAWQLKKNYGREYYGVMRSTVLIDPSGNIAFHWPKVKAKGHARVVLEKVAELHG